MIRAKSTAIRALFAYRPNGTAARAHVPVGSSPLVALGSVQDLTAHQDFGNLRDNHDMWPPFYDYGKTDAPTDGGGPDDTDDGGDTAPAEDGGDEDPR